MNKYFKSIRTSQLSAIFWGIISVASMMCISLILQNMIDSFLAKNYVQVKRGAYYFLGMIVGNIAATFGFQYFYRFVDYSGSFPIRSLFFNNIIKSNFASFTSLKKGDIVTTICDDTEKIGKTYASGMIHICIESVQFVLTLGIIAYYNKMIALISVLIVVIGIVVINHFSEIIGKNSVSMQNASAEEKSIIIETVESIRTIKMLEKENYISQEYHTILEKKKRISKQLAKYFALYADVFTFISNILPFLTIAISFLYLLRGRMTLGGTIAIYSISGALTEPVSLIGEFISNWQVTRSLVNKDKAFVSAPNTKIGCGEISFDKLSFDSDCYAFDEKLILKNQRFEVEKGKIYLLRGKSGAGKTTIFNLLTKFIPTEEVKIMINGKNINEIPTKELYRMMKLAEQNTMLFNKSVFENICLSDFYMQEEIDEAVEASQLTNLIQEKGYQFEIDEKNGNISGGEKSRIGICRMLLRKPQILLLDEPTSALDENTAAALTKSIYQYVKKYKITLLVISHRDDFVKIADQIIEIG